MTILDCTLRDGGYYTNWDFKPEIVDSYISSMNQLPIDYLEIGYRNVPQKEYLGKFGYCPISVLEHIRSCSNKKLAVMLNEKSTTIDDLATLLRPLIGIIDMVRIAVDPKNFERAAILAKEAKSYGFEIAFNLMYMSKWDQFEGLLESLPLLNGTVDIFNMVDSYGGVKPADIKSVTYSLKNKLSCKIGFHGHNNLELGLANTLAAIECGVDCVDVSILGMGRGAGNLKTELLLTILNSLYNLHVNFNELGEAIQAFIPLLERYHWGTSLPYMISGANSFPQKDVMEWVNNRVYSFNSIVRALNNRKENKDDNAKYPVLVDPPLFNQVVIVGGGNSVLEHKDAISEFIAKFPHTAIVFPTARHAAVLADLNVCKYYCLVGNESHRLTATIGSHPFNDICILPPYPRTMGTEVPQYAHDKTYELPVISFTKDFSESVTSVAIQLALQLTNGEIFLVGYDGYPGNVLSEKEVSLSHENNTIFLNYKNATGKQLKSLTPSLYQHLNIVSIYQLLD